MKKLKRILKWTGIVLVSILLLLAIILVITGIPKPPAISTENVPRLPWSYAGDIYDVYTRNKNRVGFEGWSRTGEGMYVGIVEKLNGRLALLKEPGLDPNVIKELPPNIPGFTINPDPQKRYMIYRMDKNGNERFQLYRFDFDTGTSTLLTNGKGRHSSVRFAPSGDRIIYLSQRRNNIDHDIYMMDPEDPASEELIIEMEGWSYLDSWSPDGKQVIIRKSISSTERKPYILDIESAVLTPLAQDTAAKANYYWHDWSQDGTRIYYASTEKSDFTRLHMRDLETGRDTVLTRNMNWNVSNVLESPDGKWLGFTVNEDGVKALYFYNLAEGKARRFDKLPIGNIPIAYFDPLKNSTVGFNFIHPSGENEIFTYDLETGKLVLWYSTGMQENLPEPEIVHYPTFDIDSLTGKTREITVYYHRPSAEADKPWPVIIDIHGGPAAQAGPVRDAEFHMDLKRGFAVLAPNVRGSSGYGSTFTDLDNGLLRENAVRDIGSLLDWIEKQPELDANRVVVRGGSYGGYMSLACAMHFSDRLLGVVDYVGISNFVTMMEHPDKNADRTREYGDINDPKIRAFLERISPLNNVDKISIPILIVQGKNDPRVPVSESRQMVEQLQSAGKQVWYIEAANEGHGFRKPWNAIYAKVAEFTFVDEMLKSEG